VIAIIALLAGMLLPALNAAREKTRARQLQLEPQVPRACRARYADDFDEFFPRGTMHSLSKLVLLAPPVHAVLHLPSSKTKLPGRVLVDAHLDYIYKSGFTRRTAARHRLRHGLHHDPEPQVYGNVLYGDGHVQGSSGRLVRPEQYAQLGRLAAGPASPQLPAQ